MTQVSLHSKRKLKARDAELFARSEPPLFAELAQAVCRAGIMAQKELHECWQMARVVDQAFPEALHVADLAAGHGLLGWVLLLLARTRETPLARTVVAVDIQRPPSARRLAGVITERWPDLLNSLHYVEGSLDAVRSGPGLGTLFVAAHACGRLSDYVLLAALASESPLAIMPCCHSLRKQGLTLASLAQAAKMPCMVLEGLSADVVSMGQPDAIDQFRIKALESWGYRIQEAYIERDITKFNRIVLGTPSRSFPAPIAESLTPLTAAEHQGEIRAFEKLSSLNVADMKEAQALARRPSREWFRFFDLSFWVDHESGGLHLAEVLNTLLQEHAEEAKATLMDQYTQPETKRLALTWRIEWRRSTGPITRADALALRKHLAETLTSMAAETRPGFALRGG